MIKGVIFDLDGVIVSTDDLHFEAWQFIANQEGIPFDRTINHQLRGVSRIESLEIILSRASKVYSNDEKQSLATQKNEFYVRLLDQLSEADILPGVKETIRLLKQQNIKIAIGSSSKNARKILKKIGLLDSFDAIIDGNDITYSKPHPEVFVKAGQALGLQPEQCAVVEDAEAGILAAKNAKMFAIGIGPASLSKMADKTLLGINELLDGQAFLDNK